MIRPSPLWIVPRQPRRELRLPHERYALPCWWTADEARWIAELIARLLVEEPRRILLLPPDATRVGKVLHAPQAVVLLERDEADERSGEPSMVKDAAALLVHGGEGDDRAWLERQVKAAMLSMLHGCLRDEEHPLRVFGIELLDLDEVASHSADPLDILCIAAHAIEHRLSYAGQGTDPASWRESVRHAWRGRQIERIRRLPSQVWPVVVNLLLGVPCEDALPGALPQLQNHWLADGKPSKPRLGALLRGEADALLLDLIEQHLGTEVWSQEARTIRDNKRTENVKFLSTFSISSESTPQGHGDLVWVATLLERGLEDLLEQERLQAEPVASLCNHLRILSARFDQPIPERRAEIERLRASVSSLNFAPSEKLRSLASAASALLTLLLSDTQKDLLAHHAPLETLRRIRIQSNTNWARQALALASLLAAEARVGIFEGVDQTISVEELLRESREAISQNNQDNVYIYTTIESIRIQAIVDMQQGNLDKAKTLLFDQANPWLTKTKDLFQRAIFYSTIADFLEKEGKFVEALEIRKEKELSAFQELGDVRSEAIAWGKISDVLQTLGRWQEALRNRKEKELPVFQKLGDARSEATIYGRIGDIIQAQGQLEEALDIRKNKMIPVHKKFGDVRGEAITWSRIGDIFQIRGELQESLDIRKNKELPVFQKLGDLREEAVTWSKIGDIFKALGNLEESIKIQEKGLAVFKRLSSRRDVLIAQIKLASSLTRRGQRKDLKRARTLLKEALQSAERMGLPEAEMIRQFQQKVRKMG